MWNLIGSHHPFPPEAIVEEDTRYVDAGCVKIGVEQRRLEGIDGRLQATYEGTPFEEVYREWLENRVPVSEQFGQAPATMGGTGTQTSLHVLDSETGHEYLRFDCFKDVPHYHYLRPWTRPEDCDNHSVEWDEVAHGPMMPWALDRIRTRLFEMLTEAGGRHLAARLDQAQLDRAADEVEELVKEELAVSPS